MLALLLTALAVVLVADLFWAQQIQLRSMQNQQYRLRARLAQRAALDTLIAALQSPAASTQPIALGGAWSELPDSEGTPSEAVVSQHIVDAQSSFNLSNLALAAVVNPFEIAAFGRMLTALQLDPKLAQQAAEAIARTQTAAGAGPAAASQ
ncbi:MAG TPA: type II secretion system minor pseudopilin GspK, partial [Telluria sp.]|nr:type II secretion system minor pseudopilin GspK [Telluria sp.]